jgi:hypothetical protein
MPNSSHIKINDGTTRRLNLLRGNIAAAMESGVYEVAASAVQTIRRRVETAETTTGRLRASGGAPRFKPRPAWFLGRGPGRVESGRLLESARWTMVTGQGRVSATAGFINGPSYTALQELGSPGARGVPAMSAFALGQTKTQATFAPVMGKVVGSAIQAADRGNGFKSGL